MTWKTVLIEGFYARLSLQRKKVSFQLSRQENGLKRPKGILKMKHTDPHRYPLILLCFILQEQFYLEMELEKKADKIFNFVALKIINF